MKLYLDEWLAVIGAAVLAVGLGLLGAYRGLSITSAAEDGRIVMLEAERLGSDAYTFFFSASSSYVIAFWVLVGILAGMAVTYLVAGLTRKREPARVVPLRPAEEEVESRRKAA